MRIQTLWSIFPALLIITYPSFAQQAARPWPNPLGLSQIAMPSCQNPEMSDLEAGRAFARERFLIKGDSLFRFELQEGGTREQIHQVPLPPVASNQRHFLRYRNGSFWAMGPGGNILQWSKTLDRWLPYAQTGCIWQDYDVLMDGRILLFRPSNAKGQPVRSLLEIYDPGHKTHKVLMSAPVSARNPQTGPLASLYWSSCQLRAVDEFELVYGTMSGRLLILNTLKDEVQEASLPWAPMPFDELVKLLQGPNARVRREQAEMGDGSSREILRVVPPVPACIQFLPSEPAKVFMAYEIVDPETNKRSIGCATLSLATGESAVGTASDGLELPLWIDVKGDPVPLDSILERFRQDGGGMPRAAVGRAVRPSAIAEPASTMVQP